jgi:hypothetical protein
MSRSKEQKHRDAKIFNGARELSALLDAQADSFAAEHGLDPITMFMVSVQYGLAGPNRVQNAALWQHCLNNVLAMPHESARGLACWLMQKCCIPPDAETVRPATDGYIYPPIGTI